MQDIARLAILVFALWLVAVAAIMIFRPALALRGLRVFASTSAIHFGEMAIRIAVGAAMVVAASAARIPLALATFGWLLIVTSVGLSLLPRRWHHAYALWWADRIPEWSVRVLSPLTLVLAATLGWLVI